MNFVIETSQVGCTISERHNLPNCVKIKPGDVNTTQIKSIAYQLLAMVGE